MAAPLQEPKLPPNPTIDDWLKLLGFDVNLLRSVKPGDYIFSTDHNMLVKTTKEIYSILELVNTKIKSIEDTISSLTTARLPRPSGVDPAIALLSVLKYLVENEIKATLTISTPINVLSDDMLDCPICHDSIADPTPLTQVQYENKPVNPTTAVPFITGTSVTQPVSTNYTQSGALSASSPALFVVAVNPYLSDYSNYPDSVAWYYLAAEIEATKSTTYDLFLNVAIVGNEVRVTPYNIDLPSSDFTYLKENLPSKPYVSPSNTWLIVAIFMRGAEVHVMYFDTSLKPLKHVVIDISEILSGIGYTSVGLQSINMNRAAIVDYLDPTTWEYHASDVYIDYVVRLGG